METRFQKPLWQLYARVYDAILLQFLPYRELLHAVTKQLDPAPDWHILDAGCGTGNLLCHILRYRPGVSVTGVDFSTAMLRRARIKLNNSPDVTLQEMNLNHPLPFADAGFDAVICVNVLYAVNKPKLLLRELHRVLKKNGKLLLVNPSIQPKMCPIFKEHVNELRCGHRALWPLILTGQILKTLPHLLVFVTVNGYIQGQQSFNFFSANELGELVCSSGFRVVGAEKVYGEQCWFMICSKESVGSAG